mgnify:CR=1 FL=1
MYKEYSLEFLRKKISNMRILKGFCDGKLSCEDEIELTTLEMVLENHLNDKYKDLDKWLHKLMEKNGTTEY